MWHNGGSVVGVIVWQSEGVYLRVVREFPTGAYTAPAGTCPGRNHTYPGLTLGRILLPNNAVLFTHIDRSRLTGILADAQIIANI